MEMKARSIGKLNSTALAEMDGYVCPPSHLQIPGCTNALKREQCDQLWPLTATALESQSTHTGQQVQPVTAQITLLIDELLFQRRIYQLQSLLLILIITAMAVSVAILSCNRGSTSSNSFSPGGVRGGRGFLTRPYALPPRTTMSQLLPSMDSLTPPPSIGIFLSSPIYQNIPRINYGR